MLVNLALPIPRPAEDARPGRKLEFIREQRGISRDKLAKELGLTTGALFNLENGFNPIHYKYAKSIGDYLDIDYRELMDEYTTFCQPGYGRCIQIIRLQGGYTQEEFARLLDTDRCTVAVWECEFEERHPEPQRFGKIKKIAGDLGINLSKLVENPDSYKDEYTLFVEGDYGKKIRQIRLAAAMTYKEFAISIGCEAETLEHWEIGWQKPLRKYFDAIKEIATKVGIELQKINDDPEYFGSQYQDFIGRECGKKVKSIRMAYGYTQDQLGQLVGCTGEAIGKWERELSVPDLNYYKCLENIAHQAGITIVQLNENPELYIDDYKDFCKPGYGKVLKHLRKQLGLRQVDFAEELGVSSATYRNWETERFIPMRENYNEIKKFVIKKGVDIS